MPVFISVLSPTPSRLSSFPLIPRQFASPVQHGSVRRIDAQCRYGEVRLHPPRNSRISGADTCYYTDRKRSSRSTSAKLQALVRPAVAVDRSHELLMLLHQRRARLRVRGTYAAVSRIESSLLLGKHVRSCIVYTWDHKSSQAFWAGMKVCVRTLGPCHTSQELNVLQSRRQPILADEVQTFKALITIHKVLQEGHPVALKEAQANISWLESLSRAMGSGDGSRGVARPLWPEQRRERRLTGSRLRAVNTRIHILPSSEASLPPTASRVQW